MWLCVLTSNIMPSIKNYQEVSQFLHSLWPSWYATDWPISYSQTPSIYSTPRLNPWLNSPTRCPRHTRQQAGPSRSRTENDGNLKDPCKTGTDWPGDARQVDANPYLGERLLGIQLGGRWVSIWGRRFSKAGVLGDTPGGASLEWGAPVAVLEVYSELS